MIASSRNRIRTNGYWNNHYDSETITDAQNLSIDARLQRTYDKQSLDRTRVGPNTQLQSAVEVIEELNENELKTGFHLSGGNAANRTMGQRHVRGIHASSDVGGAEGTTEGAVTSEAEHSNGNAASINLNEGVHAGSSEALPFASHGKYLPLYNMVRVLNATAEREGLRRRNKTQTDTGGG